MSVTIRRSSAAAALSLTPLIDVVFLLLIFFLVATRFAREDEQLPLKLPTAASALPMTVDPQIMTINVDADGRYFVRGRFLELPGLADEIAQAVRDNPVSQSVIIRGDRQAEYGRVAAVLDLCHAAKVPSYRLSTTSDEP